MNKNTFRAWDKAELEMIYDAIEYELRVIACSSDKIEPSDGRIGFNTPLDMICFNIMQYIGTNDCDDNPIFENDVVQYDNRSGYGIIKYDDEDASYYIEPIDAKWIDAFESHRRWYKVKVLGNIFENSDLLLGEF